MPIPVSCQCGYQVDAPDQYAGKQVSCPACQNPLQVPLPQQAPVDTMLDEILSDAGISAVTPGGYRCPNCIASIPGGAIICLECGYNVESGQIMGESDQGDKKHFGAAVYTHRSYGHEQLDTAAQKMEVELLEKDAEGPTPYWVWLFIFFNIISFGIGLAIFSLTYFSLENDSIQIASYRGTEFSNLPEGAPLDKYFLVVSEAQIASKPKKEKKKDDYAMPMSSGTYCTVTSTQNGFTYVESVPGQILAQKGWIPTMAVIPVTTSQIKLLQNLKADPSLHTCKLKPNLPNSNNEKDEQREANNGKVYTVQFGRDSEKDQWVERKYLYLKKNWNEAAARQHCSDQNGLFVPAAEPPVTANAKYSFYHGLANYCTLQFWLGIIFYGIAHVSIALQAFKDEMMHAVLASILPIYNIVWCFMRWKYVGGNGIMALLGFIMIIGSIVAQIFVPDLLPTVAGIAEIKD